MVFVVEWASQPEARSACWRRGGELLTMETTAERQFVQDSKQGIDWSAW